jgi:hypothetical protein
VNKPPAPILPETVDLPEGVVAALRFPIRVSALEALTDALAAVYGPDLRILYGTGPTMLFALPNGRTDW